MRLHRYGGYRRRWVYPSSIGTVSRPNLSCWVKFLSLPSLCLQLLVLWHSCFILTQAHTHLPEQAGQIVDRGVRVCRYSGVPGPMMVFVTWTVMGQPSWFLACSHVERGAGCTCALCCLVRATSRGLIPLLEPMPAPLACRSALPRKGHPWDCAWVPKQIPGVHHPGICHIKWNLGWINLWSFEGTLEDVAQRLF